MSIPLTEQRRTDMARISLEDKIKKQEEAVFKAKDKSDQRNI